MIRALELLWAVVAGALLSVLAVAYAEFGPHIASLRLSVGAALSMGGVPALVIVIGRMTRTRWLGLAPWTSFVVMTSILATRRPEGDLLLLGDGPGFAVLYGGALAGAVTVGLFRVGIGQPIRDLPALLQPSDHD